MRWCRPTPVDEDAKTPAVCRGPNLAPRAWSCCCRWHSIGRRTAVPCSARWPWSPPSPHACWATRSAPAGQRGPDRGRRRGRPVHLRPAGRLAGGTTRSPARAKARRSRAHELPGRRHDPGGRTGRFRPQLRRHQRCDKARPWFLRQLAPLRLLGHIAKGAIRGSWRCGFRRCRHGPAARPRAGVVDGTAGPCGHQPAHPGPARSPAR